MTPAELAKSNSEHGHQRALFAWASMATRYGFTAAWDEFCYCVKGHAEQTYGARQEGVAALSRLFAIANGGARGDDAKSRAVRGGQLKAEGVKKGVPDIMLPLPMLEFAPWTHTKYCGLFVEMKRPKSGTQAKGSTSSEQDDWIAHLRSVGYAVSVCFDWIAAAKEVQSYVEASNNAAAKRAA